MNNPQRKSFDRADNTSSSLVVNPDRPISAYQTCAEGRLEEHKRPVASYGNNSNIKYGRVRS